MTSSPRAARFLLVLFLVTSFGAISLQAADRSALLMALLKAQLSLDETQTQKISGIVSRTMKQADDLYNRAADKKTTEEPIKKLIDKADREIQEVLNPAQLKKYLELREKLLKTYGK